MRMSKLIDPETLENVFKIGVGMDEINSWDEQIRIRVIDMVAEQITKDILEQKYSEIMERVSPAVIANLAMVKSSNKICENMSAKPYVEGPFNREEMSFRDEIEKKQFELYNQWAFRNGGVYPNGVWQDSDEAKECARLMKEKENKNEKF